MLCYFSPSQSQQSINLKDYFFQQDQPEYTLRYENERDTGTRLSKVIKVLGKDTIEVSDFGSNNEFYRSLQFVVEEKAIKVIAGKRSLKEKVFDSKIGLNTWAQIHSKTSKKIQLDIRTEDTCTTPPLECDWKWERAKQTGFKTGYIRLKDKKIKTITISFHESSLYQPRTFSSIAGMTTYIVSYVFAEGVGLVKIITRSKEYKFTSTLILLD